MLQMANLVAQVAKPERRLTQGRAFPGLEAGLAEGMKEVRRATEGRMEPLPEELPRLLVRWRAGSLLSARSNAAMTGCLPLPATCPSPSSACAGV